MSNPIQATTFKAFEAMGRNAVGDEEAATMTDQELREAGRKDVPAIARWAGATAVVLAGGAGLIAHEAQSTQQELEQQKRESPGFVFEESVTNEVPQEQSVSEQDVKSDAVNQVPQVLVAEGNPNDITL